MSLTDWIKQQGRAAGFDRVGVAPATDLPELIHFPDWLERGHAGQMDYLHNPKRRDARALMPDARSVICCTLGYDTNRPRSTELPADPDRGWVSRYAWGDDYHTIVREKLEALRAALAEKVGDAFTSRAYVDTGPVLERVYAHHAGLGWLAKNTCLLDADLGSFFFLGVLITNLELEIDTPPADGCGACTLCLEACPTGALVEPYLLDARRCISYLTIELRDAIPEELRPGMGRHLFGCDICQDVAPAWAATSSAATSARTSVLTTSALPAPSSPPSTPATTPSSIPASPGSPRSPKRTSGASSRAALSNAPSAAACCATPSSLWETPATPPSAPRWRNSPPVRIRFSLSMLDGL
jgi:epoxyqueuosine reductase